MKQEKVSVHGGHSGQFCSHATGTLEEIVESYISKGFSWVGITEHIPPAMEKFIYPEEKVLGLTCDSMYARFIEYFDECRRLQQKYGDKIKLYAAMEIETYSGAEQHVAALIEKFHPDYLVGSVHHVDDIPIDYSKEEYQRAAVKLGGVDELYCRYFDQQFEMITRIKPAVVGHFDLIRIYDEDYLSRLQLPDIARRIARNLEAIQKLGLILDYNVRSLQKGADEPYISSVLLESVKEKGIAVVPGDDSHGVETAGLNIERAIEELTKKGFATEWQMPA